MLGVRLICVGKLGEKFWAQAVKEYEKRLGAYCKLEIIELPEQRLPQTPSEGEIAQALDREAALIESRIWPARPSSRCASRESRCPPSSSRTIFRV